MKTDLSKFLVHDFKKTHTSYMIEKNISGVCYGASLQWAIDVLRLIAGDKTSSGLDIVNRERFMNISHKNQSAYKHLVIEFQEQVKPIIADILNRQENFLSNRYDYKMCYSVKDSNAMEIAVNDFLINKPEYNNTALIIGTALSKSITFPCRDNKSRTTSLAHATALVNYNGSNYFFDINKGIFKLPGNYITNSEELVFLIFKNYGFDINCIPGNPYSISSKSGHLFIEIQRK